MANEIQAIATSGKSLYALIRNSNALVWNGTAFETYGTSAYSTYPITLTEQATTGFYAGTFPTSIAAGTYALDIRQSSGSPALTDPAVAATNYFWGGSAEVQLGKVLPLAAAGAAGGLPTATNASGQVQHDLTQAVPTTNTAQTVGDALNAARAQGFGMWKLVGTALTLYAPDGVTAVRTFALDNALAPTQRV